MLKQLIRLANLLDKEGFQLVADEVDALIKNALPKTDEEIEKDIERYFADPKIQERNRIEREYGLDEEGMFGLEPIGSWHGYKYTYEGVPNGKLQKEELRPNTRYHTIILNKDDDAPPDEFKDPDGIWIFEELGMAPEGAGAGQFLYTYRFMSNKDLEHEKERHELLGAPDESDDIEIMETPEDTVEVSEEEPKKQHGGGVKLF